MTPAKFEADAYQVFQRPEHDALRVPTRLLT